MVTVLGGVINQVFGGSNTKGDIIKEAHVLLGDEDLQTCVFEVEGVYGGSNEAYMSGSADITMNCIEGMDQIYGGSKKADINNDIVLTITSGTYDKVFGGNNISGKIHGSITINIEQTGCLPIVIGELYGGGNLAPYSVYGYKETTTTTTVNGVNYTHYDLETQGQDPYDGPIINIVSCQSIGKVFGGGLGQTAVVVGNPEINIDMVKGWTNGKYTPKEGATDQTDPNFGYATTPKSLSAIGVIDQVYGGGNEADVIGNTSVNIGTQRTVTVHNVTKEVYNTIKNGRTDIANPGYTGGDDETKDLTITVGGANITGNVYGGGNQAAVTGTTSVQIGPE